MSAESYPLHWPAAYPRTERSKRKHPKFRTDWGKALRGIHAELSRMKATDIVVSTNQPIRKDGMPYAAGRIIEDPGVAVYFKRKGKAVVISCDRWIRLEDNMHAVALTVEAMRGLERWGASDMLDRVFQGFTALPPPAGWVPEKPWWEILGVESDWPLPAIEAIYKTKAKLEHPDRGGDPKRMNELNRAVEEARGAKGAA